MSIRNDRHRPGFIPPGPILGVVDRLVKALGISRVYNGWQAVTQWDQIVGEKIASVAKAIRFEDGVLYVAVEEAAWRQEISMRKNEILDEIHSKSWGKAVRQIRLLRGQKG